MSKDKSNNITKEDISEWAAQIGCSRIPQEEYCIWINGKTICLINGECVNKEDQPIIDALFKK